MDLTRLYVSGMTHEDMLESCKWIHTVNCISVLKGVEVNWN